MSTINRKYKRLSIIIPVYNEERYIVETIRRVINADTLGLQKEIIIVNDGSTDNTKDILNKNKRIIEYENKRKNKHKKHLLPHIPYSIFHILEHKHNEGKGAAIKTGLLKSTGDIVLIQDADLEYSPLDYPKLLEPFLKNDANVVYGSRFVSTESRRVLYYWHSIANMLLTNISNMLTNLNLTDMETGYKVFSGELIRAIAVKLQSRRFGFEPEVTARIAKVPGLRIFEVGISYTGRTYAEGKKITGKDAFSALYSIIRYNLFSH